MKNLKCFRYLHSCLFFLTILAFQLKAVITPAQTSFQFTVGEPNINFGYAMARTSDNGYVVAGRTSPTIGTDFYVVKFSSNNSLQWSRTIGIGNFDEARTVIQTMDGGYAVGGRTLPFQSSEKMSFVKLDENGNVQWSRMIGYLQPESMMSVVQSTDGGYILAGNRLFSLSNDASSNDDSDVSGIIFDIVIVKFDLNGVFQWEKTIGSGGSDDFVSSIIRTTDGGFMLAGTTDAFGAGSYDMLIIKLGSEGSIQWARTIGGANNESASSVIQTHDGYLLAGYTSSFGTGHVFIVKLNHAGIVQWSRNVGGNGSENGYSIIQTQDRGYAVAGSTMSFGGSHDVYLIKLDSNGSLQWSRTVGSAGSEIGHSVIQAPDGGYLVAGYGMGQIFLVKFDVNGNICGNFFSPPSSINSPAVIEAFQTPQIIPQTSAVVVANPVVGSVGNVTNLCMLGIEPVSNEIPIRFELSQNYPNPFNPVTKIKFELVRESSVKLMIYDLSGREIETLVNQNLKAGIYEVAWDASDYPSGVYYYKMSAGEYSATKKMVLVK